jgi:hypothetical protein
MKPNIWINRQPIPKLKSTLKHLSTWSNQDIVALAKQQFSTVDLNNKQISDLVKVLKQETLMKVHPAFYTDVSTNIGLEIKFKSNGLRLDPKMTRDYISKGVIKVRHHTIDEAIEFAVGLVQDSKVSWEDTYKQYLNTRKVGMFTSTYPSVELERKLKQIDNIKMPLPDNSEEHKKYWGLQIGDNIRDRVSSKVYTVKQVKPMLDAPPTIVLEENEDI